MQTTPDTSLESNRRLRLAFTSLLLSLTPLAAYGLLFLLRAGMLYVLSVLGLLPHRTVALVLFVVLCTGAISGGVGAVVTGARALRRDQLQPPLQPPVRAAARAGVVIGIAGILLHVYQGVSIALIVLAGGAWQMIAG